MHPGDERCLSKKNRETVIILFVYAYTFPPYVIFVFLGTKTIRILSYLGSWHCRRWERGFDGHEGFFGRIWGVTIIIIIIIIIIIRTIIILIIMIIIMVIIMIIIMTMMMMTMIMMIVTPRGKF